MAETNKPMRVADTQHAPHEHRESFPATKETPQIAHVLKRLVPSGSHAELVALFDGRAPIATIRHWRRGTRSVPQWAKDMLEARVNTIASLAPEIRAIPLGPGKRINTRNLMAWHARNKDKKEKPAS